MFTVPVGSSILGLYSSSLLVSQRQPYHFPDLNLHLFLFHRFFHLSLFSSLLFLSISSLDLSDGQQHS